MTATYDYHLLSSSLLIATALFAIGMVGLAARRNAVAMYCSAAIMSQGVVLALCAFGSFHGDWTGRTAGWIVMALTALLGQIVAAVTIARVNRCRLRGVESSMDKVRHE